MIFDTDSHAYIATNEDLRYATGLMSENCKQVLTVVASGDHPLFCSLHAALHYGTTITVDTFDITPNARAIMDIKTAAIQCLNRDEYIRLLANLRWSNDVLNEPYMNIVSKKLSSEEYQYLCSQNGNRIFDKGLWFGDKCLYLPTEPEYQKLQEIIKKPYDFMQTDIANLSAKLGDKMYDFMHFSNIFDYINSSDVDVWKIIYPLMEHVNVGGRILSYSLFGRPTQFSSDSVKDEKLVYGNILKNWRVKRKQVDAAFRTGYGCICVKDNLVVFERVR